MIDDTNNLFLYLLLLAILKIIIFIIVCFLLFSLSLSFQFEHVDWTVVYQYMPIGSAAVYRKRIRKKEVMVHWGQTYFNWCPAYKKCSKLGETLFHHWCGCFMLIPTDILSCLNTVMCCGMCQSQNGRSNRNASEGEFLFYIFFFVQTFRCAFFFWIAFVGCPHPPLLSFFL